MLIVAGCILGLIGALFAGRALGGLLYDVALAAPPTMVSIIGAVMGVGLVACIIPGRRASAADPVTMLRGD